MNRGETNERLIEELLQARDAVRLAPNPSHLDGDLTLEAPTGLDACSMSASRPEGSCRSVARSALPTAPYGSNSR